MLRLYVLLCAAFHLCCLEAGSGTGLGWVHWCYPGGATYICVEHGAQQELLAWLGLTDGMACTAAGRQGWQKGGVYGRSNVLCWVPFPQLETE